jgi:hypothetical protein
LNGDAVGPPRLSDRMVRFLSADAGRSRIAIRNNSPQGRSGSIW